MTCPECNRFHELSIRAGKRARSFESAARVAADMVLAIGHTLNRLPAENEREFKRLPTFMKEAIRDARKIVDIFSRCGRGGDDE